MTALRYIGAGTYIHGVPARDLTEEEAAQFWPVIQEQEVAAHVQMYEPVAPAQAVNKRAVKTGAEEGGNG